MDQFWEKGRPSPFLLYRGEEKKRRGREGRPDDGEKGGDQKIRRLHTFGKRKKEGFMSTKRDRLQVLRGKGIHSPPKKKKKKGGVVSEQTKKRMEKASNRTS